jgi:ethanolamine utilization protein EutL
MEATIGLDLALKSAQVRAVRVFTPPTETNFAAAWLTGPLESCEAAAVAYCAAVVRVAANPKGAVWGS